MPRPREFDEQDVVARATDLFWRRGYHATSTRDLGDELGLSPSSLYRTFGDKHALFLRALDHYRATESAEAREHLLCRGPAPQVLRDWLIRMVGLPEDRTAARGCFVVNTATELGADDPDVDLRTQAAFDVTRGALREVLHRGCREGALRAGLDAAATAEILFTLVLGLRVRARAGHDPAELAEVVDTTVRSLQ
ncbi:TetR/AcrR family transcriptional regulator [Pseudonocardia kunmingensis]|uniref:TetR family transcriptional regulator n=1 Tax=Pseudonocardia kunmingensis TaxID=630975 RepID=A0A543DZ58_9PSEU|nr:TetR/AcrR family transcriptional regulator [Pseudonocardia kunmingensis]TQM14622.1 TetR family transcriptional regulator [Pseudonocardia kunmingensis]